MSVSALGAGTALEDADCTTLGVGVIVGNVLNVGVADGVNTGTVTAARMTATTAAGTAALFVLTGTIEVLRAYTGPPSFSSVRNHSSSSVCVFAALSAIKLSESFCEISQESCSFFPENCTTISMRAKLIILPNVSVRVTALFKQRVLDGLGEALGVLVGTIFGLGIAVDGVLEALIGPKESADTGVMDGDALEELLMLGFGVLGTRLSGVDVMLGETDENADADVDTLGVTDDPKDALDEGEM